MTSPAPDTGRTAEEMREFRKALALACNDPGHFVGYKGERSLGEWQVDALLAGPLAPILQEAATARKERDEAQEAHLAVCEALGIAATRLSYMEAAHLRAENANLRDRVREAEGVGRDPDGSGSRPSDQAASHPAPAGFDPSRMPAPRLEGPWPRRPKPERLANYDVPWIKDWRTITGRTLKEGMVAHRLALHGRMAEGCCSAILPCSHQQRDPYSLCLNCQGVKDHAQALGIEARQGRDEGSACESPTPQGGMPDPLSPEPQEAGDHEPR